jgi:hypothetical protein
MADWLTDNQVAPVTPASSKSIIWADSTTKKGPLQTDDQGVHHGIISTSYSASGVASQAVPATETYITSSGIILPAYGMQVGQLFRWYINAVKATFTGTAAPSWKIYIGTTQSIASDTARLNLTGIAQTAVTGGGTIIVTAQVRTVSASGVIIGNFSAPGVTLGVGQATTAVSATFDNTSTIGGQYVGLSLTAGLNTTYTVDGVRGELIQ